MSVRLKITTSFHQRYGLRLVVEDIDPAHTLGELERRRQLTLEALSKDGLLDANANIPFPIVPQRLAVISSDTAAGLADFREQLDANPYGYRFRLQLFTAAMQGVQTSPEIQSRLRQIARRQADYDAVIIVRGGGGRTDLAAFDEEALCRAVASFPLPVIVGIGHETDDSVLDRVAHHSLKTPTATAVWLVEQFMRAEGTVVQLSRAIRETGAHHLAIERPRLAGLAGQARQLATAALRGESQRLDRAEKDLALLPGRALLNANHQLDNLEKLLSALRPETTLARGYALVSQDGKLLLNPDDITEGEVEIRLKEGRTTLLKPGESDS
jgi:exodeoxyribonuclease VII large subunit